MLTFRKIDNLEVVGYSDYDFGKCKEEKKSTSWYIFILSGGPISWRSHKQKLTTTSTMMTEYVACYHATCHAVLKVFYDNDSAVSFSNSTSSSGAGLYLDTKYLFVRERVEDQSIVIKYSSMYDMFADPLTKGLPPTTQALFRACCRHEFNW